MIPWVWDRGRSSTRGVAWVVSLPGRAGKPVRDGPSKQGCLSDPRPGGR